VPFLGTQCTAVQAVMKKKLHHCLCMNSFGVFLPSSSPPLFSYGVSAHGQSCARSRFAIANLRSDIGPSAYGPPRPWLRSGHWADRNPVEAYRAYFPTPGTQEEISVITAAAGSSPLALHRHRSNNEQQSAAIFVV